MMEEEGHDMSNFDYTQLPVEEVDCGVRKGKRRSNTSEPEKKKKKGKFIQETTIVMYPKIFPPIFEVNLFKIPPHAHRGLNCSRLLKV